MRAPRLRRSRRQWVASGLVSAVLLAYVVVVYAVIVLGGGALLGRSSSAPDVLLSVVATAVVALTFDGVGSLLDRQVGRTVGRGQPSPYEVLRQFSGTASGRFAAEELPSRMARVLALGTGARWAQVWLDVDGRHTLAATWPPDVTDPVTNPLDSSPPGRRIQVVRHDDEMLGVLVVQERDHAPLTSVEERLFAGLATQSGLVLRGARLRAELAQRADELAARADELRLSRQRLVDAHDAERRALERDVHDGAQQHLVALAVNLRLAHTVAAGSSPGRAVQLLADQEVAAAEAVATVSRLSRGIYPPVLADEGPAAALRAAVQHSATPVDISTDGLERYPSGVEAAAYFCCLEALQNATKHAAASRIAVRLTGAADGSLSFVVEDDGRGFDPAAGGAGGGLRNMRDRLDAVDGVLTVESSSQRGTRVAGSIPARVG